MVNLAYFLSFFPFLSFFSFLPLSFFLSLSLPIIISLHRRTAARAADAEIFEGHERKRVRHAAPLTISPLYGKSESAHLRAADSVFRRDGGGPVDAFVAQGVEKRL